MSESIILNNVTYKIFFKCAMYRLKNKLILDRLVKAIKSDSDQEMIDGFISYNNISVYNYENKCRV